MQGREKLKHSPLWIFAVLPRHLLSVLKGQSAQRALVVCLRHLVLNHRRAPCDAWYLTEPQSHFFTFSHH